jgi:Sulfatase
MTRKMAQVTWQYAIILGVVGIMLLVANRGRAETPPESAQPTRSLGHVESPAKPNIIFIVAEDITTFVGAYSNREVKTPNVDQLAREGVRYTHAYQVAGVCAPARAAVITGMSPTSVGAHHMRTGAGEAKPQAEGAETPQPAAPGVMKDKPEGIPIYSAVLPEYVKPFPEYLRKAGYYATNKRRCSDLLRYSERFNRLLHHPQRRVARSSATPRPELGW